MANGSTGPGTLLAGRYRLEDLLAENGGARFWRATDTVLARSVAVHAVPSDDDRAAHLLEAARLSATVADPHLLRVLDCDTADDVTWVVNEWGDGISLDRMLQQGTLPPNRAAWLAREVAEAIATGHDHDVCHGRLNPEAVMVTHSGAVKLIGYVVDGALAPPRDTGAYGDLTEREIDVIDLAGVLYAALTGRWPGVSRSQVPDAPREGQRVLRPRQVRAGVPRYLDTLCDRVLNKEASRHSAPIETAREIAAALSDFVGDPSRVAPLDPAAVHDEPTQLISTPGSPQPGAPGLEETQAWRPSDDAAGTTEDAERTQQVQLPPDEDATVQTDLTPLRPPATDRPPVPPPFEDSPERPLFATTQRRAPVPTADAGTSGGSGEFWPFVEEEDQPEPPTGKEGWGWLRAGVGLAVLALLVVAMVVAFNLGRTGSSGPGEGPTTGSSSGKSSPRPKPLKIVSATDFDPESDSGEENPEDTPLAIDGDESTGWPTLTYRGNPALGGLKSGVGLILDLGADHDPRSMSITFDSAPTSFEVYAAPQGVTSTPTSLDQFDKVATRPDAGKQVTVELGHEPTTRYLLVWLTKLPPYPGGYRGQINEVTVRQ